MAITKKTLMEELDLMVRDDISSQETIIRLSKENKILKDRLDKAIEYCEDITSREIDISDTDYELGEDFTARDILKILRGEDNE